MCIGGLVECKLEFRAHDFQSYIVQTRYECKNIFGRFFHSRAKKGIGYSTQNQELQMQHLQGFVTGQRNNFTGLDLDSVLSYVPKAKAMSLCRDSK